MGKFQRDRKQRAGQMNIQMLGVCLDITIIIIFITTSAITVTDRMKMSIQGQITHTSHTQTHPILKDTNTLYSQIKVLSQRSTVKATVRRRGLICTGNVYYDVTHNIRSSKYHKMKLFAISNS
ncbi:uncharacterized protein LOC134231925 [Saccostrea cucullata]|uniref:uncharacterized protein LOC134231925 n=1 Tax=Saccostrea cuccullata TaxID=36930 RepID=UPI002ED3BAA4